MKEVSSSDIDFEIISNNKTSFKGLTISFSVWNINLSTINTGIVFKNCKFIGDTLVFSGNNLYNINIFFENCDLKKVYLYINDSKIQTLKIFNSSIGNLEINKTSFYKIIIQNNISFDHLSFDSISVKKDFYLYKNKNINKLSVFNISSEKLVINENYIQDIFFKDINKLSNLFFNKNNIAEKVIFIDNTLNHIDFEKTKFYSDKGDLRLIGNTFNETVYLSNIQAEKIELYIRSCSFNKFVRFNNSNFNTLILSQNNFRDISSFQDLSCNYLKIETTNFEKIAFFDDIN